MKNAKEQIGADVEAGCIVTPKSSAAAKMAGAVAGQVAGSIGQVTAEMTTERRGASTSPLPAGAWSHGYLALTQSELVLARAKQGLVGMKCQEVIARTQRDAIQAIELGSGKLTAPLTVTFDDGQTWEVDVPRANLKHARAMQAATQPA